MGQECRNHVSKTVVPPKEGERRPLPGSAGPSGLCPGLWPGLTLHTPYPTAARLLPTHPRTHRHRLPPRPPLRRANLA